VVLHHLITATVPHLITATLHHSFTATVHQSRKGDPLFTKKIEADEVDLVHGHLLWFEALTRLSAEALASNDNDLSAVTEAVDASSGQEGIAE